MTESEEIERMQKDGLMGFINKENWNIVMNTLPIQNYFLLVFRPKRRKYIIARAMIINRSEIEEEEEEEYKGDWVTQENNCYRIVDDDLWMQFPYVKIEKYYCN